MVLFFIILEFILNYCYFNGSMYLDRLCIILNVEKFFPYVISKNMLINIYEFISALQILLYDPY